jgi:predicted phosphodiesterase
VSGASYEYRVLDGAGQAVATGSFRAPPASEAPFVFAVMGDNQGQPGNLTRKTLPLLLRTKPDLLVHVGDQVREGSLIGDWHDHWYRPLAGLLRSLVVLHARGNHDGESQLAHRMLPLPDSGRWYATDFGCVRFLVLDSNLEVAPESEQGRWLAAELQSEGTKRARYRVAVFHHPPYTNLWDGPLYDGEVKMREHVVPLLEAHGIDLVLSGHAHTYLHAERARPDGGKIVYMVSGGGGGYLDSFKAASWPHALMAREVHHILRVQVSMEKMLLEAISSDDGQVFDRAEILPRR